MWRESFHERGASGRGEGSERLVASGIGVLPQEALFEMKGRVTNSAGVAAMAVRTRLANAEPAQGRSRKKGMVAPWRWASASM